jgi:protein-disulfide isomerase
MPKLQNRLYLIQICIILITSSLLMPIAIAQQNPPKAPKIMATVQGKAITEDELNKAAGKDLENLELQKAQMEAQMAQARHDALENNLKRMIQDKLFSLEAAKRGITKDQLIVNEITSKVPEPGQTEIDLFYEANKGRLKESKEALSDRIKAYLREQSLNRVTQEFVESLKKTYPVVLNLQPLRHKIETAGHPSKGPAAAPVTIVEFSDFQCTYCKEMTATLDRLMKEFVGKVRLVYRQYPNEKHPFAEKASEASLCANEQGKFWEMHALLFENIDELATDDLKAKAEKLGLAKDQFDKCLDSGKYKARARKDYVDAMRAGVSGTPSFFINGRLYSGTWPYEELVPIIKEELKK